MCITGVRVKTLDIQIVINLDIYSFVGHYSLPVHLNDHSIDATMYSIVHSHGQKRS